MSNPTSRKHKTFEFSDTGAVILIGGASQRMGSPKWSLKIGGQTLLERLVCQLAPLVQRIAISTKKNQLTEQQRAVLRFPVHNAQISWVFDRQPDSGPLEGIRSGLESLCESGVSTAFVTAVDVPTVRPALVRYLVQLCEEHDCVVPFEYLDQGKKRFFGMTAVYRTELHRQIAEFVAQGQLKVSMLARRFDCRQIELRQLEGVDRGLRSFQNINFKHEFEAMLENPDLEI